MINIEFSIDEISLINELFIDIKHENQYCFENFIIDNAIKVHNLFINPKENKIGISKFDNFVLLQLLLYSNKKHAKDLLEKLKPYEYLLKNENNEIITIYIYLDNIQINSLISAHDTYSNSGHWGSSSFSTPEEEILIQKLKDPNAKYYSFTMNELKLINIWFESQYSSSLNGISLNLKKLIDLLEKYKIYIAGIKNIY